MACCLGDERAGVPACHVNTGIPCAWLRPLLYKIADGWTKRGTTARTYRDLVLCSLSSGADGARGNSRTAETRETAGQVGRYIRARLRQTGRLRLSRLYDDHGDDEHGDERQGRLLAARRETSKLNRGGRALSLSPYTRARARAQETRSFRPSSGVLAYHLRPPRCLCVRVYIRRVPL